MLKKALKTVSPIAAIADDGLEGLKGMGVAGMLGKALRKARDKDKVEDIVQNPRNVPVNPQGMAKPAGMSEAPKMMKKGGMVTKGIDGCAVKGKTRAKRSK